MNHRNLADSAMPMNAELLDSAVIFVDEPDTDFNVLGAGGLGETGVPAMAAAIADDAVLHVPGDTSLPLARFADECPRGAIATHAHANAG